MYINNISPKYILEYTLTMILENDSLIYYYYKMYAFYLLLLHIIL